MTGDRITLPQAEVRRINSAATIPVERYQEEGCADRYSYLRDLAEDNNMSIEEVLMLSEACGGPEEDFDGLVIALQDHDEFVGGF